MYEELLAPAPLALATDEEARLEALASFEAGTLLGDPELAALARFAAHLCDAPIALVSIVEADRQRFIANHGLDADETPRSQSFCAFAMTGSGILEVPDATKDPQFADNELVTGTPHIRFYAGAPLIGDTGAPLGSLCVISDQARPAGLTELQREGLATLAQAVIRRMIARREELANLSASRSSEQALIASEEKFRILADTMPQMVWSTLPDGYHDYYNARWYEFTGVTVGSTDGEEWNGMFHPDDQQHAWQKWRHSLATGHPYEIEYRLRRHDGEYRWTLGRALPMRDRDGEIVRWFGTCTDIHDQRILVESKDLLSRELTHRIKNIFSLVGGLFGLAARERPELKPIIDDLNERLVALAQAHEFIRPGANNHGRRLHPFLSELFSAYRAEGEARIRIAGDDVELADHAVTPLALMLHELATNAVKYGALGTEKGWVELAVRRQGGELILDWQERDGPPVRPNQTEGFGSRLLHVAAERQLKGRVERHWEPAGLEVRISLPCASLEAAD